MRLVKAQLVLRVQWAQTDKDIKALAKEFLSDVRAHAIMSDKGNVACRSARIAPEKKGASR